MTAGATRSEPAQKARPKFEGTPASPGPEVMGVLDRPLARSAERVGHLQRVEDEVGAEVRGEVPAGDHPAEAVEDEGTVGEAAPGPDVRDVGDPILVRSGRGEVAIEQVAGPLDGGLVRDRRLALLATADALEAFGAHQPATRSRPMSTSRLRSCFQVSWSVVSTCCSYRHRQSATSRSRSVTNGRGKAVPGSLAPTFDDWLCPVLELRCDL